MKGGINMDIKFCVTKEERKALVKSIGEITGWTPVYKGAPSFAFAINNYTVDRDGTLIYDERTDAENVARLLAELTARGFEYEVGRETLPTPDFENAVDAPEDALSCETTVGEPPAKKTIIVDMPFFGDTALENLRKLVAGKSALIRKAIGADDLTVAIINGALHFHWFDPDSTEQEFEAYKQFVSALCQTAKNQKRVTMKESAVDSEKFAFRCFLLKLGFIGDEYKSARAVMLAKMSGSGSFKSGDHKSRGVDKSAAPILSGVDTVVPQRCGDCPHHCYYTVGEMTTSAGIAVDTSKRAPESYTFYCLNTPSGYRKLMHATGWSGSNLPPPWCPIKSAEADAVREAAENAASLAETLADAEFIHAVNKSFETEGAGDE
jgi:hypothetical protein